MSWFGKKRDKPAGPDYSNIISLEAAQKLAERGELVPLLLLPEQFGGTGVQENIVYVPSFAAELKNSTDQNVVAPLANEGKITRYLAEPEYFGASFIPIAIKLTAWDPANFTYEMAIWGEALDRALDAK